MDNVDEMNNLLRKIQAQNKLSALLYNIVYREQVSANSKMKKERYAVI